MFHRHVSGAQGEDPEGEITETLLEDLNLTWAAVFTLITSDSTLTIKSPADLLYYDMMQPFLFQSYPIVVESEGFNGASASLKEVSLVRSSGNHEGLNREERIAQEIEMLKTSLPLTANSSVFVRWDPECKDILKVLMIGVPHTPYANGCFEFDIHFPMDYPTSPMKVVLITTGRKTVRFHPNLDHMGSFQLSLLNTMPGPSEEMWIAKTSTLLQVLIAIQSQIMVPEPYFSDPEHDESRGTPEGIKNSRSYNAVIRQATVNRAMLDQLKNPSLCFKEVVVFLLHKFKFESFELT